MIQAAVISSFQMRDAGLANSEHRAPTTRRPSGMRSVCHYRRYRGSVTFHRMRSTMRLFEATPRMSCTR